MRKAPVRICTFHLHPSFNTFLFTLLFGLPSFLYAQVLPSIDWNRHRSNHFEVIYDTKNAAVAQHYIDRLPEVEKRLSRVWHHWPERIALVISDQTDLTNGFATAIPYPLIYIFPVLPSPMDTIAEYSDWGFEIVLHESTHILSFEQRRDVIQVLHAVFGSIVTPNQFLPRWWLEGIAVDGETRFSKGGRLRSNFQSAMTRAFVAEDHLRDFNYPEINEVEIQTWPYGARPYYFGSLIWSQMIAEYGEKLISDLHVRTGGRAPFFISDPTRDLTDGKDMPDWFDHTINTLTVSAQKQLKHLSQKPFSKENVLHSDLKESMSPTISPDGLHLAVIGKDEAFVRAVAIFQRPNLKAPFEFQFLRRFPQNLFTRPAGPVFPRTRSLRDDCGEGDDCGEDGPPGGAVTRLTWEPDSQALVFDFVEKRNQFQQVSDLWRLDLQQRKTRRLTKFLRGREPSMGPDGKEIAYVALGPLRTSLAVWDVQSESSETLWTAPLQDRISWPVWLNKNDLVFAYRSRESEKLMVFHRDSGRVEDILPIYRNVGFPEVSQGRLYFQAHETGVGNVFEAASDLRSAKPLTHVDSTLMNFSLDSKNEKIFATKLTSQGMQLREIPIAKNPLAPLPQVATYEADRYPPFPAPTEFAHEDLSHDSVYSPFGTYLLPHYWFPYVQWNEEGIDISVSTAGQDPLSKNAYQLGVTYYGELGNFAYAGGFINQSYWPRLSVFAQKTYSYLVTTEEPTSDEDLLGTVSAEAPWIHPGVEFTAGYFSDRYTKFGYTDQTYGPTVGIQYNRSMSLFVKRSTYNSEGVAYDSILATVPFHIPMPWSLYQALRLRFQGQYIDHDVSRVELSQSNASSSAIAVTPTNKDYLLRGYIYGKFLAKNYAVANVDYTFPVGDINWGFEHFATFFKKLSAAVVTDFAYQDGAVVNEKVAGSPYQNVSMNKLFWDYGAELSLSTTVGYAMPIKIVAGMYWPADTSVTQSGTQFVLSLGL